MPGSKVPPGNEAADSGGGERPARIAAVMAGVDDLHLGTDVQIVAPYVANPAQMARVHDTAYLDELAAFCQAGGGQLDPDTYASADSWSAARRAAGAGLARRWCGIRRRASTRPPCPA